MKSFKMPAIATGHADTRYKVPSPQIAVRFEPETVRALRKIARDDNVSFAEVVRRLVAKALAA